MSPHHDHIILVLNALTTLIVTWYTLHHSLAFLSRPGFLSVFGVITEFSSLYLISTFSYLNLSYSSSPASVLIRSSAPL